MGMKGISPIIAAVLLISITVVVGVMLSSWITHWVNARTTEAGSACVTSTNYNIDSAKFKNSTANMTLILTNRGRTNIHGFTVQILNGTHVIVYNSTDPNFGMSPNVTEDTPLEEQRSAIIIIHMDGVYNSTIGNTADQVKVLNKACPAFSAETRTITKE